MRKFKLIKTYPGCSVKVGTEVYKNGNYYQSNFPIESGIDHFHQPLHIVENQPEFWEEIVKEEYEILFYYSKSLEYIFKSSQFEEPQFGGNSEWQIYSIKRLSDGEIFTIGDKVFSEYVNYTINKIGIVNDKCMVSALYDTNNPNGSRLHYNLNNLKKAKQKLFTTEDGVDIFEGDIFYNTWDMKIPNKEIAVSKKKDFYNEKPVNKLYKVFSTKEAAEEYILMNKPCLSINDVRNCINQTEIDIDNEHELNYQLLQSVKQKLNGNK